MILLIFSFNSGTMPVFPLQHFTTKWYSEAWHDQELRDAFVRSIKVGLGTSIVATGLGILAAYPLRAGASSARATRSRRSRSCRSSCRPSSWPSPC